MVNNLVDQIIEHGEVRRGVLGVSGRDLTNELAKAFGLNTQHGGFVDQVMEGSAADNAGIKAGDIIISVNDRKIKTFQELRAKVATMGAGAKVKFGLIRDGDSKRYLQHLVRAVKQVKLPLVPFIQCLLVRHWKITMMVMVLKLLT